MRGLGIYGPDSDVIGYREISIGNMKKFLIFTTTKALY
jgi:hypothetical protein